MNLRVSVVIGVSDGENQLEHAVRSALACDLRELEVILVDNAPSDRTAALVDRTADPRLSRLRLRPGSGVARARNVGIARSSAPYVAFLEPDDLIGVATLSAAVSALERNPQAGFAFTDYEDIDANKRVIRASALGGLAALKQMWAADIGDWYRIPQTQVADMLTRQDSSGVSGLTVRRQLLTEIGPFDESSTYCSGLDLWFRLAHCCDALYWDQVGHSRRIDLLGDREPHAQRDDRIRVLRREKERWNERAPRRRLDQRIAREFAAMGYEQRRRGRLLRSLAMFACAFGTFPEAHSLAGMLGLLPRSGGGTRQTHPVSPPID
jgi:Glycosyl transferase family 2